jgi:hypothetical protein
VQIELGKANEQGYDTGILLKQVKWERKEDTFRHMETDLAFVVATKKQNQRDGGWRRGYLVQRD